MKVTLHLVALSDYEHMDRYGDPSDLHFDFPLDLDLDLNFGVLESLTLVKEGLEGWVILNGQQVASIDLPYEYRDMRYQFMVCGPRREL
jgi:hypothetical protein